MSVAMSRAQGVTGHKAQWGRTVGKRRRWVEGRGWEIRGQTVEIRPWKPPSTACGSSFTRSLADRQGSSASGVYKIQPHNNLFPLQRDI